LTDKTDKPPTYEELVDLTRDLTAAVKRQQTTIGTLQATLVAKDAELARAARKKVPLIEMDPKAKDKFRRPY
jgi:hypothetical protein